MRHRVPLVPLTPQERLVIGRKWRQVVELVLVPNLTRRDIRAQLEQIIEDAVNRRPSRLPVTDRRLLLAYAVAFYQLKQGGING